MRINIPQSPIMRMNREASIRALVSELNSNFSELFTSLSVSGREVISISPFLGVRAAAQKIVKVSNSNFSKLASSTGLTLTRIEIHPLVESTFETMIDRIKFVCDYNFTLLYSQSTSTPYIASAVHFDGSSLLKKTGLIGTPSEKYLISTWVNAQYDGAISRTIMSLFQADGTDLGGAGFGGSTIFVDHTDQKSIFFTSYEREDDEFGLYSAGISYFKSAMDVVFATGWHHVLAKGDYSGTQPGITQLYIDDVAVPLSLSFNDEIGFEIVYFPLTLALFERTFYMPDWKIVGGTQPPIQDMADFWLGAGQSLDLSIISNRRKFISADGKPVSLGANGSTPTGIQPTIFFSGGADEFSTNKGTGGAFTLVGSLTDATSGPSD